MLLFNRSYQVILGTPANPNQAVYGNTGDGAAIRVAFDVEKCMKGSPNKAVVRLYNLAPKNRQVIQRGMLLTLAVGYRGAVQTLFLGCVRTSPSSRSGPDIVVAIEAGDGEAAITQVSLDRSYDAGVTLAQVLTDLAQQMQLVTSANPLGMTAGTAVGIPNVVYGKGLVVHGPVRDTLNKLCKPQGLEWSIQDGALNLIPQDKHTGEEAEVLTPQTGLLGVPSMDGEILRVTALMNPRLTPGRLIQVQSPSIEGYFKIRGGKWEGDSHADKWQCDLEAIPAPNVAQTLPATAGFDYSADVEVG